ncbi:hydrolase [Flavobacteriaceae bacterium]|nr:hydrolase [Flavobacteriaceae bacterium]MDA9244651.1 hydrolase [Flavobacteriaceae bacterium]MDA9294436.1 hydrolase [Flavobacteriaceae bacterium]MDC0014369.1 hydrolase [Flavobacteriaceae bacterium]
MKLKIFIYLFVFTALILVFQLVNSSKVVNYQEEMIQEKIARIDTLRQQLDKSEQAYADDVYFSLDRNEEAMAYFEDLSIEDLITRIKDKVYDSNAIKGDNPLVPFTGTGGKFLINKVKILNHKWLIADFSDGTYWGELWIQYAVNGEDIRLEVKDYLLYPIN